MRLAPRDPRWEAPDEITPAQVRGGLYRALKILLIAAVPLLLGIASLFLTRP